LSALVLGYSAGCQQNCKGPSCDEEWPRTRIAHIDVEDVGTGGNLERVAATFFEGTNDERARWTLRSSDASLWLGQPEANQVLKLSPTLARAEQNPPLWTGNGDFGAALALPRILNGEVELWVAAPDHDLGAGAIFRFVTPGQGGDASAATLRVVGSSAADRLGSTLKRCADLTGDGADELLVASPWFESPLGEPAWLDSGMEQEMPSLAGAVFLLTSEQVLSTERTVVFPWELGPMWWGGATGDQAGTSLSCATDHDGDGVADIVIGAPLVDVSNTLTDAGRVYLISGASLPNDGPLDEVASSYIDGDTAHGWLGMEIQPLDLNPDDGDLALDLALGAPGTNSGRGHVQIHLGADLARGGTPKASYRFTLSTRTAGHFGRWMAAGDLDGDTLGDLVVGAPDLAVDKNGYDQGRAWVFLGASVSGWQANGNSSLADARILGEHAFERVGRSPWVVDVDEDGIDELLLASRARALD
jgi:hypothetical protein